VQLHYNDSASEVTALGKDFLENKFGNYNVSPQECVSNFSDSCRGKQEELADITDNRLNYHILSGMYTVASIAFNGDKTKGTVIGSCVFEDIPGPSMAHAGQRERVSGDCLLTTIYENWRWFLCDSHFSNGSATIESLRGRVPGRPISRLELERLLAAP
jgi:hypothetical protein